MAWYDRFLPNRRQQPHAALVQHGDAVSLPAEGDPTAAGMINYLSGLGSARDYGAHTRPNIARVYLTEPELMALCATGPYWRLCGFYPALALYRGFAVTDDTDEIAPLASELERLEVLSRFQAGGTRGHAYGDAFLLLSVEDGRRLSDPLDPARVRRVNALQPIAARELLPVSWDGSDRSDRFGQVELWNFTPRRQGMVVQPTTIHASRLIRFYGQDLGPEVEQASIGSLWHGHGGVAMGQIWNDALMGLGTTERAAAHLSAEISVAVFKISDSTLKMGADTRSTFLSYMELISKMKSLINGVLLTPDDDMQRLGANIAGFWDLYRVAVNGLSAVTGIPQSAIFGEAPGGLTTDNEAGWRMAEMQATLYFRDRVQPGLRTLVACLYGARSARLKWSIAMNPIGTLGPKEQAEVRKLHTEADSIAIADGVLDPVQVARSRYSAEGWRAEIQPATPEEMEPDPAAMGEALAEQAQDAVDRTGKLWIGVDLSPEGMAVWRALADRVAAIVGPLEGYEPGSPMDEAPHLTVLYVGAVEDTEVAEILRRVEPIAANVEPFQLVPMSVQALPESRQSEGRRPIVIECDAWAPRVLNDKLLRALAPFVQAEQFPRYIAHVTLGFARPTGQQVGQIAGLDLRGLSLGGVGEVVVRHADRVVGRLPLVGRQDSDGGAS